MDKIKDFFHDFSDVFFAIAIASVMFVVLSLNLGTWFNDFSDTVLADESINTTENNTTNPISENDKEEVNEEDTEEADIADGNTDEPDTEEVKPVEPNDDLDSNESEVESDNTVTNPEIKTIVIPNGTPGSGVAKILKENGLIDDTQEFIKTAESLNLAIRLKSGSFEIPTNSTIEDMVKIIAGQKR